MDDPDITMEEYVQLETERALRNGKVYNWETAMHSKICPQHVDEVNLKNEPSLSDYDEKYNVISLNDLLPFNIFSVNDLKLKKDNDDDNIDIKQSLGDLSIEPLPNLINIDVGTYAQGSNKLLEISHDTISKIFTTETFIKELCVNIMTWNYFNEGMLINLIKNLYVPFGIPFDPKLFYKDGMKLEASLT
ncbi:hypothetical protein Tco_0387389 [Tanacetum coccineum]